MTAHDSTRPVILRRMAARRQQEVAAGQLQALRRAGSAVFDLALVVDRKRDEMRASGTHPWDADPATASLFLAATYRQVWSLLEPVGRWIALARRAEANSDFWIGSDADLPAGLPQMLVPRISPRKHVRGLLAAGDALDNLTEQQLANVVSAGAPPVRHAQRLQRIHELFAQARASLHYAQGLWNPDLSRDLEKVLLDHLHPSIVVHHHIGQYLALPELVIAYRTGWKAP